MFHKAARLVRAARAGPRPAGVRCDDRTRPVRLRRSAARADAASTALSPILPPPRAAARTRTALGLDSLLPRTLPHERTLHKRWTQHWIGSDAAGRPVVFESLGNVDPAALVAQGITVDDMARACARLAARAASPPAAAAAAAGCLCGRAAPSLFACFPHSRAAGRSPALNPAAPVSAVSVGAGALLHEAPGVRP